MAHRVGRVIAGEIHGIPPFNDGITGRQCEIYSGYRMLRAPTVGYRKADGRVRSGRAAPGGSGIISDADYVRSS